MKMKYDILYKNGHVDVIKQEITEENKEILAGINQTIDFSMRENEAGVITFGDGEEGFLIRLTDVSRVKIQIISD